MCAVTECDGAAMEVNVLNYYTKIYVDVVVLEYYFTISFYFKLPLNYILEGNV